MVRLQARQGRVEGRDEGQAGAGTVPQARKSHVPVQAEEFADPSDRFPRRLYLNGQTRAGGSAAIGVDSDTMTRLRQHWPDGVVLNAQVAAPRWAATAGPAVTAVAACSHRLHGGR